MNQNTTSKSTGPMFDSIAHRYDFLNHLLSIGFDYRWRRTAVREMALTPESVILDIATGTCDLALEAVRYAPKKIVGSDIAVNMLRIGRSKIEERRRSRSIELVAGSAEHLAFKSGSFDAAMAAFGVRNFSDLDEGLRQIQRVLKPGGRFVVLEFSKPRLFPFKQIYFFYFRRILPLIGRVFSNDKSAYTYLPESVMAFPENPVFKAKLIDAGFSRVSYQRLTLGIVTLYKAVK